MQIHLSRQQYVSVLRNNMIFDRQNNVLVLVC